MRLRIPKRWPSFLVLTPFSLKIVLLVIGVALIAVIIYFVPARYDQAVERKRPVFTLKNKPTTLAPNVQQAVKDAFLMELTMYSNYVDTVNRFGVYGPYAAVIESEQVQLKLYQELAQQYKFELDKDRPARIKLPPYAGEACQRNINEEQAKVAKYKQMLPKVEEYPDVYKVFNFSLNLSERGHLRVLKRCL